MAYRYIVVNMGQPLGQNRAQLAAELARAQDAYLVGRHYTFEPRPRGPGAGHAPTSQLAATTPQVPGAAAVAAPAPDPEQSRAARQAKELFEQALKDAGVRGEFDDLPGSGRPLWENLLEEARCADLTVVGKPSGASEEKDAAKHLVAESGGPVLVIPDSARETPGSSHVLVAWNGSREAARAVRDAIPLIERAGRVTIEMREPRSGVEVSARRLQSMLEQHGADCEIKREPGTIGASDSLISRAEESGADVIVMGAYGRARLREVITGGGTTGKILAHATVPLLMAQ